MKMNVIPAQLRSKTSLAILKKYEMPLAAMAWRFYQKLGRGYLYVPAKGNQQIVRPEEIVYFEKDGELWHAAALNVANDGNSNDELHTEVSQYNPRQEFVVLVGFIQSPPSEHYFRYKPRLSPPEASTTIRHQF